jgi:hypothetical protein
MVVVAAAAMGDNGGVDNGSGETNNGGRWLMVEMGDTGDGG